MLSQTATRSLSRRAQPSMAVLSSRIQDKVSQRCAAKTAIACRKEPCARAFASPSSAKLSPLALQRLELLGSTNDQTSDFVKNALHAMLNMKDGASKRVITKEELGQRLKSFQSLIQEARQCIEDCADSAESDDFHEEAVTAREAVEEACSSFADIIDDLEGAEDLRESYPFGVVKRSDYFRLSEGMKVQKLKEELAVILREWRSPPHLRQAE